MDKTLKSPSPLLFTSIAPFQMPSLQPYEYCLEVEWSIALLEVRTSPSLQEVTDLRTIASDNAM
jgi:hypothetical protein